MSVTLPLDISLQIVHRPAIKLAGCKIHTDRRSAKEDIGRLFNDIAPQINALSDKKDPAVYGISWIVDAKKRRFNYCMAVKYDEQKSIPDSLEEIVIPSGLYAEFLLYSKEDLHQFYDYLYLKLQKEIETNFGIGEAPYYEIYPNGYQENEPIKLYIPVISA